MRTLRATYIIGKWVFTRPKPASPAVIANRARAQRATRVAADHREAIARELAARGRAMHLYRTEGPSEAALQAQREHERAELYRAGLEITLFRLRAHRIVPA